MIVFGAADVAAIVAAYLEDEGWVEAGVGHPSFALAHERPVVAWWNSQVEYRDVHVRCDPDSATRAIRMGSEVNTSPIGVVPPGSVLLGAPHFNGADWWLTARLRRPPLLWNEIAVEGMIVPCGIFRGFEHEEES